MTRRNLAYFFGPKSVALIGASDRANSIGRTVLRNLTHSGFAGPVWPVNVRHREVGGLQAYARVADLPAAPDLAVLCTPAPTIPGLIMELSARGTRAAIVLSAGLEQRGADGRSYQQAALDAARSRTLRILGPNCLGLLVPGIGLNASFAHCGAHPGNVAFVAQSGALTTAMLDWAQASQTGFSRFVSLGNAIDVDFGDLLDQLATDPETRAILLYIESLTSARKFMSAARAAARNKPVIAVKSGRTLQAAHAAHSHSGALAGSDAVYEAVFRRCGVLRVNTTRQLFDAAEVLARMTRYRGPRLVIVSNGGGPGVMATDALIAGGGQLASLSDRTHAALDALLPGGASHGNPLDIGGDSLPQRYAEVLPIVLADPNVDALLVIHAPTALASVADVAEACRGALAGARCPAILCWMGAERRAPTPPGEPPVYTTPEEAVEAFLYVMRHHQRQALLMQVPGTIDSEVDAARARAVIDAVLATGRRVLTEPEAKQVLAAYGIPVVETRIARSEAELTRAAEEIGYPVALKILSHEISHKSDVGGVTLDITSPVQLLEASVAMRERCQRLRPTADIAGFTVQKMVRRGGAHELLAGIGVDSTFGPVIVFGQGGTAVEAIADRALALPPLDAVLARDLIDQTRVARVLGGYREQPPVDFVALERVLISLAQLAADLPQIEELDINPLLVDARGVIALDARIEASEASARSAAPRLAIRPYRAALEESVEFEGQSVLLRPIRPEDFAQHQRFLQHVTPEDLRSRFFVGVRELPLRDIAHLTQIDYDREMAFIAVAEIDGQPETLGVARASADPENDTADFAVLVRSDLKGHGLGRLLMTKLIGYCRARGTRQLHGEILVSNVRMRQLAVELGFVAEPIDRELLEVTLPLRPVGAAR